MQYKSYLFYKFPLPVAGFVAGWGISMIFELWKPLKRK
jgi:hypothetical protein